MFPLHSEIALRLAHEHAAEERRHAARRRLARDAREPRATRARPAILIGFARGRRGPLPADERPASPLPAPPIPAPAGS